MMPTCEFYHTAAHKNRTAFAQNANADLAHGPAEIWYNSSVMARKGNLNILVAENVSMKAAREIIAGALRYAATKHDWNVFVHGGHPLDLDMKRTFSRPDGIITGYGYGDPFDPVPIRIHRDIPTVFTCVIKHPCMKAPFASIHADDRAIGRTAAECLAKNKLRHFAFIGARDDTEWQKLRLESFRERLAGAGISVSVFTPSGEESESWEDERRDVLAWIESLPKPCGIFAVYDARARFVLDVCREAGIKVPAQVQVLGVDDETYFCEYALPTLSSISPDFEGGGFLAAQTLDALLGGKPIPRTNLFGIKEVVERLSTSDTSGAANRVARARDMIRSELKSALSVAAIARKIGCSARLLEKDFKSVLGRSVIREICEIRMSKALDLLKRTAKSEEAIATECGYGSPGTLRNAFRTRFKTTMREWRAAQSKPRQH